MAGEDEHIELALALREILTRIWPDSASADEQASPEALSRLWSELGANEIPKLDSAGALAAVMRELGRAGAAVPLIGAALLRRLAGAASLAGIVDNAADGEARVAFAFLGQDGEAIDSRLNDADGALQGDIPAVENWPGATHVLVFPPALDRAFLFERDADGIRAQILPGLAVPPLAAVALHGVPAQAVALEPGAGEQLLNLARLLLVARAAGAARRGLELATDYVQLREQFGQAIGRFQALQHKLADCLVAVDVADLLIASAADALDQGGGSFEVDALAAFASPALRRTLLEIHHSFGAIGYSEEHELPRHFRRVHADLIRLGGAPRARLAAGKHLLAGYGFPDLVANPRLTSWRDEIRAWLDAHWTPAAREQARRRPFATRDTDPEFVSAAGRQNWLAINWPVEQGGLGLSPLEQLAFVEETERAGAPLAISRAGSCIIAPALIRHGNDEQRARFLPGIARGDLRFCLGYSEPQAGSDLASLRTRAIRDGDDFVINGQKLWTTLAESATHVFLAARTDPDAKPKHAGISLFILPTDAEGVTIRPGMALYGRTFSTVFYDDVRIPAANLVGPLNGGWKVLTSALASERVLMGGQVARMRKLLEEMAAWLAPRAADPIVQDRIGALAADLQAARLLSLRSVELLERGQPAMVEGAISKLFSGDLAERLGETGLELIGTPALLSEDAPGAPLDGALEQHLRFSIMAVIGGGTAEIQRTLIAQRGLGLPR